MLSADIFHLPADASTDAISASRPSCEELVQILQHLGATIIARQEHGVLLRARRRLIFLRRRSIVDDFALLDALHAAGVGVSRFVDLLDERRRAPPIEPQTGATFLHDEASLDRSHGGIPRRSAPLLGGLRR
jgi:hypothetical protein